MRKKETIEKINNYYRYFFILLTSISIYVMTILFKNVFYGLFDLDINVLNDLERNIINITYQIFGFIVSLNFFIKNRKVPLDDFKVYLRDCGIALATIIVYSLTSFLELVILYYSRVNLATMSITFKTIYLIACETLVMGIICLINRKKLEDNLKDIKVNFMNYIDKYIKYYILAIFVVMVSNLMITAIYPSMAGNEENIVNIMKKAPVYMVFSATIFAPIVEELVFRLSIRRIIKDNLTFIITSGLIFGGMHVVGNINNFYDVLYIIPYSAPGIAFAYILTKTDNVLVPISIHFMHNSIMMIFQIIWLFVL